MPAILDGDNLRKKPDREKKTIPDRLSPGDPDYPQANAGRKGRQR